MKEKKSEPDVHEWLKMKNYHMTLHAGRSPAAELMG